MPTKISRLVITLFISIAIFSGCAKSEKSTAVIKIGAVNVTAKEFEDELEYSSYAVGSSQEARKEFLNNLITRILILREAERLGYNRDPEFLRDVEFFWRQALIKLTLDRKIKEIASTVKVYDQDVRDYYNTNKDRQFVGKTFEESEKEARWLALGEKQKEAINAWLESLKKQSRISIDYKSLKIEE